MSVEKDTTQQDLLNKIREFSATLYLAIPLTGQVNGTLIKTKSGILIPKHVIEGYQQLLESTPDIIDQLKSDSRSKEVSFMLSDQDDLAILMDFNEDFGLPVGATPPKQGDVIYTSSAMQRSMQTLVTGTIQTVETDTGLGTHVFSFLEENGKDSLGYGGSSGKPLICNNELVGIYVAALEPDEHGSTLHYGVSVKDALEGEFIPVTLPIIVPYHHGFGFSNSLSN
jgi:hypothetical protein